MKIPTNSELPDEMCNVLVKSITENIKISVNISNKTILPGSLPKICKAFIVDQNTPFNCNGFHLVNIVVGRWRGWKCLCCVSFCSYIDGHFISFGRSVSGLGIWIYKRFVCVHLVDHQKQQTGETKKSNHTKKTITTRTHSLSPSSSSFSSSPSLPPNGM